MGRVLAGVVALNYIGAAWIGYLTFASYADHSTTTVAQWGFFYLVALIQPFLFGVWNARELKSRGITVDRRLRLCIIGPGIVGGMTFLVGLNLIWLAG
jgi:hypothetical protein